MRVRRPEPGSAGDGEYDDGRPFEEDGGEWEVLRASGASDVQNAEGEVGGEEGEEDYGDPEVLKCGVRRE